MKGDFNIDGDILYTEINGKVAYIDTKQKLHLIHKK